MLKKYWIILVLSLCGLSNAFAGYADQVASDKPVAWWRLMRADIKQPSRTDKMAHVTGAVFAGDAMIAAAGIDGGCGWFNGNQPASIWAMTWGLCWTAVRHHRRGLDSQ